MLTANEWRELARIPGLLDAMYQRRCFVCGRRGQCSHREPEVELALMATAKVED